MIGFASLTDCQTRSLAALASCLKGIDLDTMCDWFCAITLILGSLMLWREGFRQESPEKEDVLFIVKSGEDYYLLPLYEYNKKRRDLGMEQVSKVDDDWERVLFLWKYRIDGEIYTSSEQKTK